MAPVEKKVKESKEIFENCFYKEKKSLTHVKSTEMASIHQLHYIKITF